MKILEIIPSLSLPAGAETFMVNLSCELLKIPGTEVEVISLYNNRGFLNSELEEKNIKIHYLNKCKGFDFKTARQLRRLVLSLKPDVIHSHISTKLTLKLSGLWNKNKKYKCFHTVHSIADKEASRFMASFMGPLYKKRKVIPIAISNIVQDSIRDYYGFLDAPIIYNGIPLQKYRSEKAFSERPLSFVNVARLAKAKNHKFLIEGFSRFLDKHPEYTLDIVGDGVLKRELEQLVFDLKRENNIFLRGMCENIPSILEQHKYFVLTSFYEGTPITILEAMASGLQICSSRVGGIPDMLKEDEAFLYESNSQDDFARALEAMISSVEVYDKMTRHNQEKVARFSLRQTALNYWNTFASYLEDKKK